MITLMFAALIGAAACSSTPPLDPCQINPTKMNEAGQWVEQDDEPMDADPCDSDDLDEAGHVKPKVKKPTVKKTTSGSGGTTGNKPFK